MTTILVVDDEILLADMLGFLLEDEGYDVVKASHGLMALKLMREVRPAVVITDFMMPLMTGLELAKALRADPEFKDVPVILMSGAQGAIGRSYPHLFSAVFDKPYSNNRLLETIRSLVVPRQGGGTPMPKQDEE